MQRCLLYHFFSPSPRLGFLYYGTRESTLPFGYQTYPNEEPFGSRSSRNPALQGHGRGPVDTRLLIQVVRADERLTGQGSRLWIKLTLDRGPEVMTIIVAHVVAMRSRYSTKYTVCTDQPWNPSPLDSELWSR